MTKTFCFLIFPGTVGIRAIFFKREDIGNMLPICVSNALLNMCTEPEAVKHSKGDSMDYIVQFRVMNPHQ